MDSTLITVGVSLLGGMLLSRMVKRLNLPSVTAYLMAGILIGPCCLGLLGVPGLGYTSFDEVEGFGIISDMALGFIAFSIGNEFRITQLRKTGRQATIVAVFQALTATAMVDVCLLLLHLVLGEDQLPVSTCIVLGSIATATAPAATIMVINQYKAKGPVTDILLPVVALDDAVGLIVFAISNGIAKAMGSGAVDLVSILVNPLVEIVGSLLLGTALGYVFSLLERFFTSNNNRLTLAVTFVLIAAGLSKLEFQVGNVEIGFSSLLVCMMLGTVFCNLCDFSEEIMYKTEQWTSPLYVAFFVLSGAELQLSVFSKLTVVAIGVVYIAARSAGKILGANVSSRLTHCEPTVCKYLGITLLPQAGVALGMSVTVAQEFGEAGAIMRSIVLFAVMIYELVGPMLTKIALTKAGEIRPKPSAMEAED